MQLRIPKRVIQTGKNCNLGLHERAAVATVKLLNPGFEYLFFDDHQVEAFLDREFPQYRGVFDSFRVPIQKYDFFRYLAVYHYGGFYLDLDVFLASSLGSLLNSACVFSFEEITLSRLLRDEYGMDWEIGNYAFGAAPEHPFLKAIIENCVRAQNDPKWVARMMRGIPRILRSEYYVLNTTGPGLVSRTLAENPQLARDLNVLFPEDVCDRRRWHQFGDFGVHLMEGSWRIQGNHLRRRLGNLWEVWAMRRALAESRRLGKTRAIAMRPGAATPHAQLSPSTLDARHSAVITDP